MQETLVKAAYLGSLAGGVAGNIGGGDIANSSLTHQTITAVLADPAYANLSGTALQAFADLMAALYTLYAAQLASEAGGGS